MLRSLAWRSLTVVLAYAAAWTIAYSIVMGGDFRYFSEYLRLAWTSPGETPSLINVTALGLTLVLLGATEGARAVRRAAKRAQQRSDLER